MGDRARVLIRGHIAVMALALALASSASAKTCYKNIVPPGQSGSSQYVEVIPTSCGGATPPAAGNGTSGGSRGPITRLGQGAAGVKSLSRMGSQGQAAAALAAATAPAPAGSATGSPTRSVKGSTGGGGSVLGSGGSAGIPSAGGSSAAALGAALSGSDRHGLGTILPILLAVLLGAALGAGLARVRRGGGRSA